VLSTRSGERVRAALHALVVPEVVQQSPQTRLVGVTEVVQPDEVDRLNRATQLGPCAFAQPVPVARREVGSDIVVRALRAVLVSKRAP
jgi:hypothetical protein